MGRGAQSISVAGGKKCFESGKVLSVETPRKDTFMEYSVTQAFLFVRWPSLDLRQF
jgi:hypothetical protein